MPPKVHTLELRVVDTVLETLGPYREVQFYIDGENLCDVLRRIEAPFAAKEGHPRIAGGYVGLHAGSITPGYFLGEHAEWGPDKDKTALLECSLCANTGCWTFAARIVVEADCVTWQDFENVHRNMERAGRLAWDYGELGILRFDKQQYLREVRKSRV